MRYGPDHKALTRQRIVEAAAKVFRRRGFQAAGVDEVMSEAGLTAGGFYAHFKSKEDLFAEAFLQTLEQGKVVRGLDVDALCGAERVRSIAGKYLSPTHRGRIEDGCPLPPLLADLPRQNEAIREAFQALLLKIMEGSQAHYPEAEAERRWDHAVAVLATMIGGMSLARAVPDKALGERIMQACRRLIDMTLEPTDEADAANETPQPAKTKRSVSRVRKQSSTPSPRKPRQ